MTDVEKASRRHCWSDKPPSWVYEAGFEDGAAWQRLKDIEILQKQHEGCQTGTLVSYSIAANILMIESRPRTDATKARVDKEGK